MARSGANVEIGVLGLNQVMRALREVDKAAAKEMRQAIAGALEPIRARASRGMKRSGDAPHIADSLRTAAAGSRGRVYSRNPAAGVLNFGGTIRPRGVAIRFPTNREQVYRAAAVERRDVTREIAQRIEEVGARNGL